MAVASMSRSVPSASCSNTRSSFSATSSTTPQQERDILVEIYEAKGLSYAESDLIVDRIMKDPERAIDTFVREEIGSRPRRWVRRSQPGWFLGAFATGAWCH